MQSRLRSLPAVDSVAKQLPPEAPLELRLHCARQGLQRVRQAILAGGKDSPAEPAQAATRAARQQYDDLTRDPVPSVINATGTVLHTGLGRAPLSERAQRAARRVVAGYCLLEFDRESGGRGNRQDHVAPLLCALTGAEAALVVNNCAGATVLVLQALAQGRSVPVSRGELVEIGGSFRVPEIMACAGCRLREIGSTNRTHLSDYERAIDADTAILLRVQQSNFVQQGFVSQVTTADLAPLAKRHNIPLVIDQGSGCCSDLSAAGYALTTLSDELRAGAEIVCGSGDKLLGGPQAGLIIGRKDLVERCARHPLARALRCDKVTLASLAGTLQDYVLTDPRQSVPSLAMLTADPRQTKERAEAIARVVPGGTVRPCRGAVGSGALPTDGPDSWCWCIAGQATARQRALRHAEPPLIARVQHDELIIDCGTIFPEQLPTTIGILQSLMEQ